MQLSGARGVDGEQPAQRKIDIFYFLQVEAVTQASQALNIGLSEGRSGGGSELSPFITGDLHKGSGVYVNRTSWRWAHLPILPYAGVMPLVN